MVASQTTPGRVHGEHVIVHGQVHRHVKVVRPATRHVAARQHLCRRWEGLGVKQQSGDGACQRFLSVGDGCGGCAHAPA